MSSRQHVRVLEQIFEHPIPRNLEWPDVVSLVEHFGSVEQRHDGKYAFRIGTAEAVIGKPHHKDVTVEEIVELRRFLTNAGVTTAAVSGAERTIVLIDHHHARFFAPAGDGAHLVEREHLEPKDPHGFERHLEHRKEAHYKGERVPEPSEFYERVAQHLKGVPAIVLAGDGTGKSSAMAHLHEYLRAKHKDVAEHVVAAVDADLSSIGLGEIEQLARTAG